MKRRVGKEKRTAAATVTKIYIYIYIHISPNFICESIFLVRAQPALLSAYIL